MILIQGYLKTSPDKAAGVKAAATPLHYRRFFSVWN